MEIRRAPKMEGQDTAEDRSRGRFSFKGSLTEDIDASNLALTLTRSIWVLIAAWACTVILNLTVQYGPHPAFMGIVSLLFLALCLSLVRRKVLWFPVYAVPSSLLVAIGYLAVHGMGLRDEVMLAIPPCVLLATLFLGRRGAFLFSGLSLALIAALYVVTTEDRFLPTPRDSRVLQAFATILLTSLALLWPAVTSIRHTLRRAREDEASISAAYAKLNEAQGLAHIGSWERDLAEVQEAWSEELYRVFQIEPGGARQIREELLARVHPEDLDKATRILAEAAAPPGTADAVYRLLWTDGRVRFVHERCETHSDPEGHPVRMMGTVQDITERREQEEERRRLQNDLLQSQKMESVGRLAGGVAHDFNNLLTAILGFAEMAMTRSKALDPQAIDALRQICKAGERAKDLTRQLLAFGRKQTLEIRPTDLNSVIEGFDKMLQRIIGEDIEIEAHLDPQTDLVMADPAQIEQILLNLAVNARDAMPQGGRLTIETRPCEVGRTQKGLAGEIEPGRYILLAVTDTGCGMPPETAKMVFEPFFTTKDPGKGTGLGLSTVYGIVKQHRGHIALHSEEGAGTTFRVYLPCAQKAAESRLPAFSAMVGEDAPPDLVLRGSERVLLIEDDAVIRSVTAEMLQSLGYHVIQTDNPHDAVRIAASERRMDLVLTDVVMPGMGGHEAAMKILAMRPGTKVLFMSGFGYEALASHGVAAAPAHFLQKPFTVQSLSLRVREALEASSAPAPLEPLQPVGGGHEEIAVP